MFLLTIYSLQHKIQSKTRLVFAILIKLFLIKTILLMISKSIYFLNYFILIFKLNLSNFTNQKLEILKTKHSFLLKLKLNYFIFQVPLIFWSFKIKHLSFKNNILFCTL